MVMELGKRLFSVGLLFGMLGICSTSGCETSDPCTLRQAACVDVIATARTFGYGAWRITLQDGSVWEQIDDERPVFDPVKGDRVKVYKAALGTYKMNISSQRAIKVRRVE